MTGDERLDPPGGIAALAGRPVARIGFGAMQLPGPRVLGPPRDREAALAVLDHVIPVRMRPRDSLRAACQLAEGSRALRGPRGEVAEVAADVLSMAESGRTARSTH